MGMGGGQAKDIFAIKANTKAKQTESEMNAAIKRDRQTLNTKSMDLYAVRLGERERKGERDRGRQTHMGPFALQMLPNTIHVM